MKWSKKAVSIMLSLAMVITTLSLPLPSVKAETQAMEPETKATNARTIFIAGKEGSGDYDPSMGYYGQNWYYNDGYTELSDGQTVWQDHGQNMDNNAKAKFTYGETWSILELDGYQTYGTAGYLFLKGLAQDRYFYGIYYDGNLEIILKDENMIEAYNTDTLDCLYGIYVTGDLLIISETGDHKGSLDINMHGNKNETVRGLEYGIYCGGKFMVAGSGDYPRIDAKVGAVTGALSSSIGVQSCGIHCKTYSQTGGKVTGRTDKVKWSYGVAASNITVSGGTLIGKGLAPEGDTTYGIRARGNINVSGGRVIGQAGDNETQADRVYGIYIDGGESVFSGGEVLGQAYKANLGCGIQTGGFTLPDYSDATVTGLGSACAKDYNYGIRVYGEGEAASVTISGGNVHAVGGETSDSYGKAYGMYVYNANLTIDQTGVLSATAGDSHGSYGLYVSSLEV
ncbi:MAG: hypothetical protein J6Z22_01435, partial [Lachnospiraceae bacterium]|nr:hypothetical protein [Lachnospiraceae bacterium]